MGGNSRFEVMDPGLVEGGGSTAWWRGWADRAGEIGGPSPTGFCGLYDRIVGEPGEKNGRGRTYEGRVKEREREREGKD